MARALVFGGTGQIGFAVSKALLDGAWRVDVVTRGGRPLDMELVEAGANHLNGDNRNRQSVIAEASGRYDAVFDPTCFDARDAADLLAQQNRVDAYCVVSSASVYVDEQGRTLDEAHETGFPDFQGKLDETNPSVSAGDTTYSRRKIAMEQAMLGSGAVVTILRPCAVYGVKARHPREWWFVKRALDERRTVPVCFQGQSVFHTSSTTGIASLTRLCFERRETAVLNVADPAPLTVNEISVAIGNAIDHAFELRPFAGPAQAPDFIGRTPWSAERPIALSTSRAMSLGWEGGPDYAQAVGPYCKWLIDTARRSGWQDLFPSFRKYSFDPFNYDSEEAFLRQLE